MTRLQTMKFAAKGEVNCEYAKSDAPKRRGVEWLVRVKLYHCRLEAHDESQTTLPSYESPRAYSAWYCIWTLTRAVICCVTCSSLLPRGQVGLQERPMTDTDLSIGPSRDVVAEVQATGILRFRIGIYQGTTTLGTLSRDVRQRFAYCGTDSWKLVEEDIERCCCFLTSNDRQMTMPWQLCFSLCSLFNL